MLTPARSFLLTTPCDDGHKFCFWESLRRFETAYHRGQLDTPHRFEVMTTAGDSLVPRARNNHVHAFMTRSDLDYIFPIDSDLDFIPADILRLADLAAARDLDFLAGRYAIKQEQLRWCENGLPGEVPDAEGVIKIAMAPGGIHLISRRCLSAMIAADPTWAAWPIRYTCDASGAEQWDLYHNGVVRDPEWFPDRPLGRYLSEDWGISYLARKLGFSIYCDTRSVALHRGEIFYPLGARRLTQDEVQSGMMAQPDGTQTPINPPEKV